MNTLDSPVEALAFNYLRFDKLWTRWVSVLAAAAAFWRIKVPSLSPPSKPSSEPCQAAAAAATRMPASDQPSSTAPRTTVTPFSASEGVDGGSTKGKFAAYFDCSDELAGGNDVESNGNGGDGGGGAEEVLVKEWYGCWERVMEMRMGEMGWFRYQDITVIDGNVVRLWEGGGRRRSTAAVVGVGCVVTTWQSSIGRHC